jgi:hypothetical protein
MKSLLETHISEIYPNNTVQEIGHTIVPVNIQDIHDQLVAKNIINHSGIKPEDTTSIMLPVFKEAFFEHYSTHTKTQVGVSLTVIPKKLISDTLGYSPSLQSCDAPFEVEYHPHWGFLLRTFVKKNGIFAFFAEGYSVVEKDGD